MLDTVQVFKNFTLLYRMF